jgi:hypothetical protein
MDGYARRARQTAQRISMDVSEMPSTVYGILLPYSHAALASRFHPPPHSLSQSTSDNRVRHWPSMISSEIGVWQLYMDPLSQVGVRQLYARPVPMSSSENLDRYRRPMPGCDNRVGCQHPTSVFGDHGRQRPSISPLGNRLRQAQ